MRLLELTKLIEQQTRAEIMARLGPMQSSVDYFRMQLLLMDKVREELFGSSNLVTLGIQWGIVKPSKKKRTKRTKKRSKKKYKDPWIEGILNR